MSWDTPIGTVWPALVAVLLLVISVSRVWREVRLPRGWYWVAGLALVVRLLWVPALEMHQFDGHEAEYWDLFRGFREPSRGGTVMVPAMQWFWWLLGHVLPESHGLVLVISAVTGVLALGFFSGAVGLLVGRRAGWLTAVLLTIHPTHAAWSSSAYNVILPHLFGCLAVFATAFTLRRSSPPGAWAWVAAFALSLSIAFRLDSGSMAWLVLGFPLLFRPKGVTALERVRQWAPAGLGCVVMAALCAWPLIWPGELPGAGERSLSFGLNIGFLDVYHPYDSVQGLSVVVLSIVLSWRAHWRLVLPLLTLVLLHHLMMATFDDFGERHAVVVIPAITTLVATASVSRGVLGSLIGVGALALQVVDLQDLRERFYGTEPAFLAVLDGEPWQGLQRVEWSSSVPGACGWVAEDARVANKPALSHFNILHPNEEREHRSEDGCLQWCVDVQDWRWSSRGVRDRALRLGHLFHLTPGFVVTDSTTGYGCVVMEVGERRPSQVETPNGNHKAAPRGDPPIP